MIINEAQKVPTFVRMAEQINQDRESDPISKIRKEVGDGSKPRLEEPALVHPFNTSVIKIRNNGMIDMWAGTDQGMRLDPETRTINVITDGFKHHVNYERAWIVEDLKYWAKKGFLFESEAGDMTFKCINYTAEMKGKTRVSSIGDIDMDTKGNMTITCKGNLTITAKRVDINKG